MVTRPLSLPPDHITIITEEVPPAVGPHPAISKAKPVDI